MINTFEKVYKDHYEKLYTLAFRMTGNKEEAEDVLQTSFLNAYKSYNNFRNQSSVSTWLYKIVMNTSKKYYREARKLPLEIYSEENNISMEEIYSNIKSFGHTENEAIANLTRETCLQMFMNCMPSKYRAVFTLRNILHFSVKETAEILEISANNVKTTLSRAKKITKDHMESKCSLIKPGAICDCRSCAKYLLDTKKTDRLFDIITIRNKEKKAVAEFNKEIQEIYNFEELYATTIKPIDYNDFIERVKILSKTKSIKILEY